MIRTIRAALASVAAVTALSFAGASFASAATTQHGWPAGNERTCSAIFERIDDLHDRIAREHDDRDRLRLERQLRSEVQNAELARCIG